MFQVLLFEGIPGSGKTTLAKRVRAYLDARGVKTRIVHEGDIHPIDLAWCSYMDEEDFKELIEKYKDLQEEIRNHTEKRVISTSLLIQKYTSKIEKILVSIKIFPIMRFTSLMT